MRNSDIETLEKVALAMREYFPIKKYDLYEEYVKVYEHLRDKNDSEKQSYQDKAEYYRETSRKWRQENKERHKAYQKEWQAKNRIKKAQAERAEILQNQ